MKQTRAVERGTFWGKANARADDLRYPRWPETTRPYEDRGQGECKSRRLTLPKEARGKPEEGEGPEEETAKTKATRQWKGTATQRMKPDAKGDRGETPLAREPERRPTHEPEASGALAS